MNERNRYPMLSRDLTSAAKGLAIIAVVMSHIPRIIALPNTVSSMLHPLGYLGVSIFLVLSGYGCATSLIRGGQERSSRLKFLKRRLLNVLPPLAVCIFITVILRKVIFGDTWPLWEIILNCCGFISTIGRVTWYITYQYICYILLLILGVSPRRKTYILYWLSSLGILLLTMIVSNEALGLSMWGLNTFSFQIGVLWAISNNQIMQFVDRKNTQDKILLGLFILVTFCIMFSVCYFVLKNPSNPMIQNPLKSLIAACSGGFVLYFISAFQEKVNYNGLCVAMSLGKYSYEIFLVHGIIIFCFAKIFVGNTLINIALLFVLTSIGAILLKIVSNKIIAIAMQ